MTNLVLFAKLSAIIALTAILGTFASFRFKHAGEWLPSLPNTIGIWEGIDAPHDSDVIRKLGNPLALGKLYVNPFGERVTVSVIAAGAFENYHDPTVCVTGGNFLLTSKKIFPIDGPGSGAVRAMAFRYQLRDPRYTGGDGYPRIIMYYWQQNRDGTTDTEARMGNYRDVLARFRTGFGAVAMGHQTCLIRVYGYTNGEEKYAEQTQRNVEEISRAVYRSLKKNGSEQ